MQKSKIEKLIKSFNELDLGGIFEVKSIHYCGKYIMEIKECDAEKHHIYLHPDIVRWANKNRLRLSVQNIGSGGDYMRIVIL